MFGVLIVVAALVRGVGAQYGYDYGYDQEEYRIRCVYSCETCSDYLETACGATCRPAGVPAPIAPRRSQHAPQVRAMMPGT